MNKLRATPIEDAPWYDPRTGGQDNYLGAGPGAGGGNPMAGGMPPWPQWGQTPFPYSPAPNPGFPYPWQESNSYMPWQFTETFTRQGGGGGQRPPEEPPPEEPNKPGQNNRLAWGRPSGGRYGYTLESSVPWDYHEIEGWKRPPGRPPGRYWAPPEEEAA